MELKVTPECGDLVCSEGGGTADSDDYSYSFDLVKDTKNRLKNLEKEAEVSNHEKGKMLDL